MFDVTMKGFENFGDIYMNLETRIKSPERWLFQ